MNIKVRSNRSPTRLWPIGCVFLCAVAVIFSNIVVAHDVVAKQVHLIIERNRLIASNIRFSRFDELKIKPQEKIVEEAIGNAVIVVITNERVIGYGVSSGWRTLSTLGGEKLKRVSVQDFSALVLTNKRMLNFNGNTGKWGQQRHGVH
ncbi:MAG: hypothetical protein OER96_01325 [Gammaproteobacteria bacterium]|nr:hypothetical protein [Gammaproteobacteria bacterium]